jgi:hypothetical protein
MATEIQKKFQRVYSPRHHLVQTGLVHSQPAINEEVTRLVEEQVKRDSDAFVRGDIRKPLTPEQAVVVQRQVQTTLAKAARIRKKIDVLESQVDEVLLSGGGTGKEVSFNLDLKRKPLLKLAVKLLTGRITNTLTYSTYKEALRIKKELEAENGKDVFKITP